MSAASPSAPTAPTSSHSPAIAWPLLIWLSVQVISILISASRMPLSAHYPQPAESLAVWQLLALNVVTLSLLSPVLLRNWTAYVGVILMSAPMFVLASILSSRELSRVAIPFSTTVIWATVMRCALAFVPTRFHLIVVALANLLTFGGIALWYVAHEFVGGG